MQYEEITHKDSVPMLRYLNLLIRSSDAATVKVAKYSEIAIAFQSSVTTGVKVEPSEPRHLAILFAAIRGRQSCTPIYQSYRKRPVYGEKRMSGILLSLSFCCRYGFGVSVACLSLVMVVLVMLGVGLGLVGWRPKKQPFDRTAVSHCGGRFLLV